MKLPEYNERRTILTDEFKVLKVKKVWFFFKEIAWVLVDYSSIPNEEFKNRKEYFLDSSYVSESWIKQKIQKI